MNHTVIIRRKVYFNCAHRLHSQQLTDDENRKVFGKCNNPNGHGHNYTLIVCLKGPVDPLTGMVLNLTEITQIINQEIVDRFDHKHLNKDTKEFSTLVPTAENIVIICWKILKETSLSHFLFELTLLETENNSVTYRGGNPL